MNKQLLLALSLALCLALPCLAAGERPPEKTSPDLTVTKVTAKKILVKGKPKLLVTYTVKNIGTAAAPASLTRISLQAEKTITVDKPTPPLKPNEGRTTSWSYDLNKVGKYNIQVGADYRNSINETNEMNNQNAISFGFSRPL